MADEEIRQRAVYQPNKQLGMYFGTEDDLSLADKIAALPESERDRVIDGLDMETFVYNRDVWLRPSQLTAVNSTQKLTVCLAGRGWGKTRVLSEAIQKYAMEHPGHILIILGRTTSDVRDVLILGDSGIMSIAHPDERPLYKPQIRRLIWKNGAQAMLFSAERPDSLRGAQAHFAACDEIAAYRNNPGSGLANAFDQVRIATRLPTENGINQIVVATTPKRTPIVLNILKEAEDHPEQVLIVRGSTFANRHLSKDYQETVTNLYAGTTLGKQELEGELLVDVEGALLQQSTLDLHRTAQFSPESNPDFWKTLPNRAIGVDPSVSANPNDECGIVVVGATGERKMHLRHGYVLEDASVLGPPEVWAKRAIEMARKYRAPIIAESNQGGEMVRMIIKGYDERVPVLLVHAKLSKFQRAEPVAAMYQRGRMHHCGESTDFEMLESQWTGWAPGQGLASPDRMDSCVDRNTMILMADGTEKPIYRVKVGDYVHTRWGAKRVLDSRMTDPAAPVQALRSGDRILWATANHPVWSQTRNEFVRMDAMVQGHDTILTCVPNQTTTSTTSNYQKTSSRDQSGPVSEVWNLEVEDAHEYFANGILTHNCVHAATALMVKEPKGLGRQIEIAANVTGRRLETVLDHDPFTGVTTHARHGTASLTDEQIRDRLRIATDIAEEDLEPHEDDANANAQLRKANRPSRIPLSTSGGTRTSMSSRLYGPPNRFVR